MDSEKRWSDQLQMGEITLRSRVCMAALTRTRCDPKDGVASDLLVQYYSQRSGAALILSEASAWSLRGEGYPGAADIFTKEQAQGWKKVVNAVHKKGAKMFIQIYHAGRVCHPSFNGNQQLWAPSPLPVREMVHVLHVPYPVPKEMTIEDIKESQQEFKRSVILAKQAGFDGVEIHGANGYLIEEFLKSESNVRKDDYGGSYQKRCRYCLQLVDIALQYFKPYEVGIKLSPSSQINDIFDENPVETYSYLLEELSKKQIGFVELVQSSDQIYGKSHYPIMPTQQIVNVCETFRPFFKGVLIGNFGFTPQTGLQAIQKGIVDMISFGRFYISNPDLAERILQGHPLNPQVDYKTFYGSNLPKEKGYTDFPTYEEEVKRKGEQKNPTI